MLAKIISYKMLNHDVLGITLELSQAIPFKPGQWALIDYKDPEQPLKRAYSIADYKTTNNWCQISLIIKLLEWSKSWSYLKNTKEWEFLEVVGIFWHFVLQNTDNPKVFIWTGTGLAPLIAMAREANTKKSLYFSVSYKSDLFYLENIKDIKNLETHVHISRETIDWYEIGRIDLANINFEENTEFYICWNPTVVNNFVDILQSRWFDKIYTEKY